MQRPASWPTLAREALARLQSATHQGRCGRWQSPTTAALRAPTAARRREGLQRLGHAQRMRVPVHTRTAPAEIGRGLLTGRCRWSQTTLVATAARASPAHHWRCAGRQPACCRPAAVQSNSSHRARRWRHTCGLPQAMRPAPARAQGWLSRRAHCPSPAAGDQQVAPTASIAAAHTPAPPLHQHTDSALPARTSQQSASGAALPAVGCGR